LALYDEDEEDEEDVEDDVINEEDEPTYPGKEKDHLLEENYSVRESSYVDIPPPPLLATSPSSQSVALSPFKSGGDASSKNVHSHCEQGMHDDFFYFFYQCK
jgi:hypothetical protein